jgi:hypothetical protein
VFLTSRGRHGNNALVGAVEVVVVRRRRGARRSLPNPQDSLQRIQQNQTPNPWSEADTLEHVKQGKTCNKCRHWLPKEKGQEELKRDQFWERAFRYHGDGTDLSPRHLGDPKQYSICNKRGCACHELSSCEHWDS